MTDVHATLNHLLGVDATRVLSVFILLAARLAPLSIVTPWLVGRDASLWIRVGVTVSLSVALLPLALAPAPALPPPGVVFVVLAVRELLFGAVFAIATALPFFAYEWAGLFTDTWRGAAGPLLPSQSSPLGNLYLYLSLAMFAALGGLRLVLGEFARALGSSPVAGHAGSSLPSVALGCARLASDALAFSVSLAIPAGATIAGVELASVLVVRAMPSVAGHSVTPSLRLVTGLGVALLGANLLFDRFAFVVRDTLGAAIELAFGAGP